MTATIITGPWSKAPNLSADSKGSIHDDERAKELGFKGALVGGSVLCAFITPLLTERFGRGWYERGFFKTSFISPVYETDDIRVVLEEQLPSSDAAVLMSVGIEKRDGSRATAGYAGIAPSTAAALPPWQRSGEPPTAPVPPAEADPSPGEPLGMALPPKELVVAVEDSASRRRTAGDGCLWYEAASPWGGPVVPTFMYLLVNLGNGGRRPDAAINPASRAGMNGTFQLVQTGPMLAGRPYTLNSKLVEKGISGRTAFRTAEFSITDSTGQRVALARQKARWFIHEPGAR